MNSIKELLLPGKYPIWHLSSTLPVDFQILDFDMTMNYYLMDLVRVWDIDQINFPGSNGNGTSLYRIEKLNLWVKNE